jgi:hypothetical protein
VFFFSHGGTSEPTVESEAAVYIRDLKAIGTAVSLPGGPGESWHQQAQVSLTHIKVNIEKAGSMAHDLEHRLAAKSSASIFAKAAAGAEVAGSGKT